MLGKGRRRLLTYIKSRGAAPRSHSAMKSTRTRKPCASAQESRASELRHALALLRAGAEPEEIVEALSRRLTNRLLHLPTQLIASAP